MRGVSRSICAALSLMLLSGLAMPQVASAKYLQCVPVARQLSGIQIYGNANTWWRQASGKYHRGSVPQKGAVMVFRPHRGMRLGHVAYVSEVIDARTVRLTHSNWSRINGRRGQIEYGVPAVDVSPNNDWSKVRVWYHSVQGLGGTHWPLSGFIYPAEPQLRIEPDLQTASQYFDDVYANYPIG